MYSTYMDIHGKFLENVVFFIFLVKILKKLGFGFAMRKRLDPDSHWGTRLDPDPHQ